MEEPSSRLPIGAFGSDNGKATLVIPTRFWREFPIGTFGNDDAMATLVIPACFWRESNAGASSRLPTGTFGSENAQPS
jgi:hypothetical protein